MESKMTKASKEKAKFRQTSTWKKFRKVMHKAGGGVDYCTGKPLYKGWQLHHLDMALEHYKQLDQCNFRCLNRTTHEIIHFLFRYKNYKEILKNIEDILDKMTELNKGENNEESGKNSK